MSVVVNQDRHLGRGITSRAAGGSGGGNMDDTLKRLCALEISQSDVRAQVSAITAVIPHLATKADVQDTRVEIQGTRTEIQSVRGEVQGLRAEMHAMEARIIKWMVGTGIASAAVASGIASLVVKFVS
jgi:hypothetical protein